MQVSRDLPFASRNARSTKYRRNRRIHSARKRADRSSASHLLPHLLDGGIDKVLRRPQRLSPTDLEDKVAQNLRPVSRVVNLRMELHRKPLLRHILDSRHSMSSLRRQLKSRRQLQRLVPMRHPHRLPLRQSRKQHRLRDNIDLRMPILALIRRPDLAAQRVHHELQPVTDAKHGQPQLEHARIRRRRIFVVDRPRRAREHNPSRSAALHLIKRSRAGEHHRKNILFADAARDELRILRAKVEDYDGLIKSGLGFHG